MCKSVHYLDVKLVVHGVPRCHQLLCIVFQVDLSSILRVIYDYSLFMHIVFKVELSSVLCVVCDYSLMSEVTRAYPLLVCMEGHS